MYKLGEQHSSARAESVALRCHKKTWRSSAPQWNRRHTVKDNAIGWRYSECDDRGLSTGGIQTSSRVAGARGEQHEKHRVRKTAAHRYWRQGQVKTESTDVDPTGKARRIREPGCGQRHGTRTAERSKNRLRPQKFDRFARATKKVSRPICRAKYAAYSALL